MASKCRPRGAPGSSAGRVRRVASQPGASIKPRGGGGGHGCEGRRGRRVWGAGLARRPPERERARGHAGRRQAPGGASSGAGGEAGATKAQAAGGPSPAPATSGSFAGRSLGLLREGESAKDRFSPAGARGRRRRWSRARPGARGRRCTVTLNSGAPGQGAPGLSPQPSRLGSGGLSPRESRRLPPSPREDIQVRQNPLQRGEREPDKRAWSAAQ